MDSEGLLQCPYDKSHMIRPSRFPYHLVKCRENHPLAGKVLATCPYNARHKVPKKELEMHMESCENKVSLDEIAVVMQASQSSWQSPPCEENWDLDETPKPTTFVLNGFNNVQPYDASEKTKNEPIGRIPGLPYEEFYPVRGRRRRGNAAGKSQCNFK
ncbi:protein D7-like [Pelobates fuscus]|uniref:protein D7-like n=1 Tax=Pelobates fuscus TaxID=191477 RepID=UPI002FE4C9BA